MKATRHSDNISAPPGYQRCLNGAMIPRTIHTRCWRTGWENWHLDSVPNGRLVRIDHRLSNIHETSQVSADQSIRQEANTTVANGPVKINCVRGAFRRQTAECYFCKDLGPVSVTTSALYECAWMSKTLTALVGSQISDAPPQRDNQSENRIFIPRYGHS